MNPAKMAELIDVKFRGPTVMGQRKHVLEVGTHWRHLANTVERSVIGGDLL